MLSGPKPLNLTARPSPRRRCVPGDLLPNHDQDQRALRVGPPLRVSSFLRALHVGTQGDALWGQYADRRSEFEGSHSPVADREAKPRSPPRCTTGREGQPATRCIANGTRGTTSPKRFPERNTSDNLSWTSESVCQSAYGQRPVGLAIWAVTAAEKLTALTTSVGRVRSRRSRGSILC
jgi:hypothetical protein